MFDSHCHLDDDAYDADRSQVIARARAAGVEGILIPGYEPEEWDRLAEVCALDPMLRCGVGLHPWYVHELSEQTLRKALDGLGQRLRDTGAVAVGECGLDGAKAKHGGAALALQEAVLHAHLDVAAALALPVILHCVDAHGPLLALLERRGPLAHGGVMHSYSGAAELIPRYAKLGLSFSFAGIVTHQNAKRPRRALAAVPLELLLVESDGPDQAWARAEVRRSEPAHVVHVLDAAASVRPEPRETLARAVRDNARRLLRL